MNPLLVRADGDDSEVVLLSMLDIVSNHASTCPEQGILIRYIYIRKEAIDAPLFRLPVGTITAQHKEIGGCIRPGIVCWSQNSFGSHRLQNDVLPLEGGRLLWGDRTFSKLLCQQRLILGYLMQTT